MSPYKEAQYTIYIQHNELDKTLFYGRIELRNEVYGCPKTELKKPAKKPV